jgi:hypothetical protein
MSKISKAIGTDLGGAEALDCEVAEDWAESGAFEEALADAANFSSRNLA